MYFFYFEFFKEKEYLLKVRDMFCFMVFILFRYLDLVVFKLVNLVDGYLDFCIEKIDDKLYIVLNEYVMKIIEKYFWYKGDIIFFVLSN